MLHTLRSSPHPALLPLIAGCCALVLGMGIGRFVYNPLLPGMMATHGFDTVLAGDIAGWNYIGYLVGAFALRGIVRPLARYRWFAFWIMVSIVCTILTGVLHGKLAWVIVRFLAGLASAGVFVLCAAIVFDKLAALKSPQLSGFLFGGVGAGIAIGALLAPLLERVLGNDGAWISMGLLCLPLAAFSLYRLYPQAHELETAAPSQASQAPSQSAQGACRSSSIMGHWMLVSYFFEGLGYIITGTFLVTMIMNTTGNAALANASWALAGAAAMVGAPAWTMLAKRWGYPCALACAFCVQITGILLPVLAPSVFSALCGGIMFGCTLVGITALSLPYSVTLNSRPSSHTIATMTAVYGIGQILGPFAVSMLSARGYGFQLSFLLSGGCVFLGLLALGAGRFAAGRCKA